MSTQASMARQAASAILERTQHSGFDIGLVLGSGLGPLADEVEEADIIPYSDVPHFAASTVPGHAGRLVLGRLGGKTVWIMQGRLHYYEGYDLAQVTLPMRAMCEAGIPLVIITNAAGGVRLGSRVGDLMVISDHLNMLGMAGHTPLRGPNDDSLGPRFPSMSCAYDSELLALAQRTASEMGIALTSGVYAMVAGPNFETPAEVRFLRTIGADAVGMSTVPEVLVARHAGMRVLGISLITNVAVDTVPVGSEPDTSHEEVLQAGRQAIPALASLLRAVVASLPRDAESGQC